MNPQDSPGSDPASSDPSSPDTASPDPSSSDPSPAAPPNDSLTQAGTDSTANFWFNDVGSPVAPCGGVPAPTTLSQDKKHWVEIALFDKDGKPIPNENYSITVPGGSVVSGSLNAKGRARVNGIDPGTCKVTFPNLDQHSWKPR
jgi:hypothetical protein